MHKRKKLNIVLLSESKSISAFLLFFKHFRRIGIHQADGLDGDGGERQQENDPDGLMILIIWLIIY